MNNYNGLSKDVVDKNVALTLKMREYAFRSAEGNTDIVPYYMAMLEWVLPIVCYSSVPLVHKRFSMIVAGLLCDKAMKLMR